MEELIASLLRGPEHCKIDTKEQLIPEDSCVMEEYNEDFPYMARFKCIITNKKTLNSSVGRGPTKNLAREEAVLRYNEENNK